MISIIIYNNNNSYDLKRVKNIDEENLYKKCGYKNSEHFTKLGEKNLNNIEFSFFGKNIGKEIYKYKIHDIIFYNKVIIIKKVNNNYVNIHEDDINILFNNLDNKVNENIEKDIENNKINQEEINIEKTNDNETNEYNIDSELSEEEYIFSDEEN